MLYNQWRDKIEIVGALDDVLFVVPLSPPIRSYRSRVELITADGGEREIARAVKRARAERNIGSAIRRRIADGPVQKYIPTKERKR